MDPLEALRELGAIDLPEETLNLCRYCHKPIVKNRHDVWVHAYYGNEYRKRCESYMVSAWRQLVGGALARP